MKEQVVYNGTSVFRACKYLREWLEFRVHMNTSMASTLSFEIMKRACNTPGLEVDLPDESLLIVYLSDEYGCFITWRK